MIRGLIKSMLGASPGLEGAFRRHVWSRVHFSEAELRILNGMPDGSIDVAIDVGAALGSYSWVLERKSRRVLAYEPGARNGAFLEKATAHGRVELIRAAVGAEPGELDLFTAADDDASKFTATLSQHNPVANASNVRINRVPVVSLDTDLAGRLRESERVDLVKVDVEGFENAVIAGATAMIDRHRPLIICEIEVRHNPDHANLFQSLRASGYVACFWSDGRWHRLGQDIASLQNPADLDRRITGGSGVTSNRYINNFVFQHSEGRLRLLPDEALEAHSA